MRLMNVFQSHHVAIQRTVLWLSVGATLLIWIWLGYRTGFNTAADVWQSRAAHDDYEYRYPCRDGLRYIREPGGIFPDTYSVKYDPATDKPQRCAQPESP